MICILGNSSNSNKFKDNIKIGRQISSEWETMVLQDELNRMHEWAVKWQMEFKILTSVVRFTWVDTTQEIDIL